MNNQGNLMFKVTVTTKLLIQYIRTLVILTRWAVFVRSKFQPQILIKLHRLIIRVQTKIVMWYLLRQDNKI